MSTMASQIISLTIAYSTVYSSTDQRKHQSSASLAFVRGIHRWPVSSPQQGPVTRKTFPFADVIMKYSGISLWLTLFGHRQKVGSVIYLDRRYPIKIAINHRELNTKARSLYVHVSPSFAIVQATEFKSAPALQNTDGNALCVNSANSGARWLKDEMAAAVNRSCISKCIYASKCIYGLMCFRT